ncbi:efflux RND transporter permease subunit [Candidatus Roizmanbacteria bacterium]|nr:efflux RND transporter permease subunit [Candidatus Roizmanbacteria bacterium]
MVQENKKSTYLSQLQFDEKLNRGFVGSFFGNIRLPLLLMMIILIVGLVSYFTLSREVNPSINIPIVTVMTVLPGASPKDVETLITIPLEDQIRGISGIDTLTSVSQQNVSAISMQFVSGTNSDKAKTDVQAAVDSVKTLPADAQKPSVQALDFQNTPIWTFAITSSSDVASLMTFAKSLNSAVKDIPQVQRVAQSGYAEQEIQVIISPEVLRERKINPAVLSQTVGAALGSYPAGNVKSGGTSFSLSLEPTAQSVAEIRNIRITSGGDSFLLGDIATVQLAPTPDQSTAYYASAHQPATRAVVFNVYKTKSSNIDQAVAEVRKVVNEKLASYHGQFSLVSMADSAEEVDTQFGELSKSFTETVLLIFIVLFIFLGIRQAAVASIIIPLVLLATFAVMKITGISLNFISLFSLLIALGLIVDDTIVIISAISAYYNSRRFTPNQAALLVFRDFLTPITTTTITKVWAFLPLLLATGIIGEFIKPIPVVVSTSLLASAIITMFITLPFMMVLLRPSIPQRVKIMFILFALIAVLGSGYLILPKTPLFPLTLFVFIILLLITYQVRTRFAAILHARIPSFFKGNGFTRILDRGILDAHAWGEKYRQFIEGILSSQGARRKVLFAILSFFVFSILLLPLGFVVNEFFPGSDSNQLYVNLTLPEGTTREKTQREMNILANQIRSKKNIQSVIAESGASYSQMGGGSQGSNNALLTLLLVDKNKRQQASSEIATLLRNQFQNYQNGTVSVQEVSGGPPAGSDIQIKLLGDDLAVLNQYANQISNYLNKQPGVTGVELSVKPGTGKVTFIPNPAQLNSAGLNEQSVGLWLRSYASGFKLGDITIENDKYDIYLRTSTKQVQDITALSSLVIPGQTQDYSLSTLGSYRLEYNPTTISRETGKRTISVSASAVKGYSVSVLSKNLEQYAKSLVLPPGYSWKTGGVNEENSKSVQSILQAMGLSMILILTTMVIEFGSFRKALIVIMVIPLAVSGVFVIFALTGTPLSFPALIGVLALFGIVVNNSIVLVDKIDQNLRTGFPLKTSISEASASRMEPILLTSFCAIAGLIPITISDPIWRGLGGAIISGLTFSGAIMLLFIPIVFYVWFREEPKK